MGGKAILLVVISFSLMFTVVKYNSTNTTSNAVERLTSYYIKTNAHNIASSAANIAANELFKNPNWSGYAHDTLYMNGGYAVISVNKPANAKAKFDAKAVYTVYYAGQEIKEESRVNFVLSATNYSRFGYYTKTWGSGYLVTGDTIDGPFHTQDILNTLGSPVFLGKVTTKNGIKMEGNKYGFGAAKPEFTGGYETPVDVPFTLNTSALQGVATTGGKLFQDPSGNDLDIRLVFKSNGTVDWSKRKTGTSSWSTPINAKLDTLASNGVIWNKKGNLYLSGTVNGKYTVGTATGGSSTGNVYLENDIVYRNDPLKFLSGGKTITNPDCQDMLGIVAQNQVVVKDNAANRNDINIHAALFNYGGGISVEGLTSSKPNMGIMRIHGSLIENTAQTTGYTNGAGYNQVIKYDKRYRNSTPPSFPATTSYEIVSWFE
ncbi:MAG: hypothetical protein HYS24_12030 [Ignavibacteriales bacterium]|nr:hypothetical protein [Ignavibacteriales bacterium]MBK7980707.1 hypothetical protein [Ignavibacteriota bacterium]